MVTEDEYKAAQAIVDQYHQERQQQAEWDLEDDDFESDPEDCEWCGKPGWQCKCEAAMSCTCGAYTKGGIHVADCICGAD
jgi:hypothetical protein